MLVVLAATGVLRGLKDTRTPLLVIGLAGAGNILLNLVLVYTVGLGVAGFRAWHRHCPDHGRRLDVRDCRPWRAETRGVATAPPFGPHRRRRGCRSAARARTV